MPIPKYFPLGSFLSACVWLISANPSYAATWTVNTTADPGPAGTVSLRQAINDAASVGDTINFDPSLSGKVCKVTSTLSIFKQVTITSAGLADGVTVSAGGKFGPVFSTGQQVNLTGLTITGGNDTGSSAGGIANGQNLILTNCKITGNKSAGGAGAIYSTFQVNMTGTTLSNNTGNSGTVYSYSSQPGNQSFVTMTGCTVTGNNSTYSSAVEIVGSGIGVFNTTNFSKNISGANQSSGIAIGGDLTVTTCNFTDNTGAAVFHSSDGRGQMTLTGCNFTGNNAGTGSVVSELSTGSYGRTITVSGCKFLNNTGGGIVQNSYSNNVSSQILNISGSQFTGNTLGAITNTFATVNLSTSTVNKNGSYAGFGTLVNNMGTMSLTNSTVANNTNVGLGAVYSYAQTSPNKANLTVTYSTISGNKTTSGRGGGVVSINQGPGANATINTSTIYDNVGNATSGNGGGVYFDGGTSASTLTLIGATITKNSAHSGGGVYIASAPTATVSVDSTIISGNSSGDGDTPDISGTVVSKGYNVVGKIDGSAGWISTDQTGDEADPLNAKLAALANNGGPTLTCALQAGSPAINKGDPALKNTQDQRGTNRPATPDAGAFESN